MEATMRKYTISLLAAAALSWLPIGAQADIGADIFNTVVGQCDGQPTFAMQKAAIEAEYPGYKHVELTDNQRATFLKGVAAYVGHPINFPHVWMGRAPGSPNVAFAFVQADGCVNGAGIMPTVVFEAIINGDPA